MKKIYNLALFLFAALLAVSCQDKDYDIAAPVIAPIAADDITGSLDGDNYVWTWTKPSGLDMQVNVYNGNVLLLSETVSGDSFTQRDIDTNIRYTYVFKLTDGENVSLGVVKQYMRPGAARISGLSMSQVEKNGGYDAVIVWNESETAESIELVATNGATRTVTEFLPAGVTTYTIPDVVFGEEWNVTLTAVNADGRSLPAGTMLKIGKTAIGFLSVYATPEELVANGDDDEASAWLWIHEEYPTAQFIYFGDITSASVLEPYRVLFWMRDLEGVDEAAVFTMPEVVNNATGYIKQWYAAGGNLLLWSHATVYIGELGRIDSDLLKTNDRTIGTGFGGNNGDVWSLAVSLNPAGSFTKDHSSHPIYRGLETVSNDRCKLIPFKGPGWTEDHNCLFFNIPSALTSLGNQDEACYNMLTQKYGIYPLGTWDSQIDCISQLNVWEAQQGDTEYKGTVLCFGNGGCEFSMRNPDGTPDVSAHPSNNCYQDNVLKLAKNSLEYLKTR
ncbi:MAG: DUF4960 domain-containing protein [Bacteroidales bacterium]|nr:DUF4960 domain-containing protein [Bacteroidales bacterium]MBD5253362.1 DUF4960 domain-containing protein [Barnesiella sp.]